MTNKTSFSRLFDDGPVVLSLGAQGKSGGSAKRTGQTTFGSSPKDAKSAQPAASSKKPEETANLSAKPIPDKSSAGKPVRSGEVETKSSKPTQPGDGEAKPSKATRSGDGDTKPSKAARSGSPDIQSGKPAVSGEGIGKSSKRARSGEEDTQPSKAGRSGSADKRSGKPPSSVDGVGKSSKPVRSDDRDIKSEKPTRPGDSGLQSSKPVGSGEGKKSEKPGSSKANRAGEVTGGVMARSPEPAKNKPGEPASSAPPPSERTASGSTQKPSGVAAQSGAKPDSVRSQKQKHGEPDQSETLFASSVPTPASKPNDSQTKRQTSQHQKPKHQRDTPQSAASKSATDRKKEEGAGKHPTEHSQAPQEEFEPAEPFPGESPAPDQKAHHSHHRKKRTPHVESVQVAPEEEQLMYGREFSRLPEGEVDNEEEEASEGFDESLDEGLGIEQLQQVFALVLEEGAFNGVLQKSAEQLPDLSAGLKQLPLLEQKQIVWWYQQAIAQAAAQSLVPPGDSSVGINEMIGQARCILLEHRLSTRHRLNIGVLGPRHSGKSTFLQLLYNELLLELIAIDQWKNTFVFVVDLASLASSAHNFVAFYRGIVAAIFLHLSWQRPHFRQHYRMIQAVFDGVTSGLNPPPFPKAFARDEETIGLAADLANLAGQLSRIWQTPDGLVSWLINVALLPRHIASIFGFSHTIVVLDHFDSLDVLFTPDQSPFPDSTGGIWLYDAIKVLLTNSDYIIAAQDENAFCGLLPSGTAEVSIDLGETITYCSTLGLLSTDPAETDSFTVTFAEDPKAWNFASDVCGGAPGFLALWKDFEETANTGNSDEEELLLATLAQEILRVLLRYPEADLDPWEVLACKKRDNPSKEA
jgi:hypothetical protein